MGFIAIFMTFKRQKLSKSSKCWPYVDGYIIHSNLSFTRHRKDDVSRAITDIRYYYIVNGKKYEGTKVAFVEANPREYVNQYKAGDKVKVFYSPNNYNQSVLINGCHGGSCDVIVSLSVIVAPFFLVGIGVFIFG